MTDIPQRPRPFANGLAIGTMVARAANHGSKWVCVLELEGIERMPEAFSAAVARQKLWQADRKDQLKLVPPDGAAAASSLS
jgi:hypothetical protein